MCPLCLEDGQISVGLVWPVNEVQGKLLVKLNSGIHSTGWEKQLKGLVLQSLWALSGMDQRGGKNGGRQSSQKVNVTALETSSNCEQGCEK